MQTERRTTSLLNRYAEMPPILCKHFANECKESFTLNLPSTAKCYAKIVQIERRTTSLLDRYAEMPPILCKNTFFLRHIQASHRFLSSMLPRMILLYPTDDLFYLPQIPLMNTDFPPAH